MSQAEAEIKEKIRALIDGELSLDGFYAWFVPATWSIERSEDPMASELVSEVELRLAEAAHGHWSETETKDLLATLVRRKSPA